MSPSTLIGLVTGLVLTASGDSPPRDAILLQDYASCGPISLFLVCRIRQVPVDWDQVKSSVGASGSDRTHSFADLSRAATQLGMHPVGLEVGRVALQELPMPAIVQVRDPRRPENPPHLLVLLRAEEKGVHLLDAPYPAYFLPESRFAEVWTGKVLAFAPSENAAEQLQVGSKKLLLFSRAFWTWVVCGLLVGLVVFLPRWVARGRSEAPRSWITPAYLATMISWVWRRRLRVLLTASLCVVPFAGLAAYEWMSAARARTQPTCSFEKPVLELGELAPGSASVPVAINNSGSTELRISGVSSTCACAAVTAPEVVQAGQAALLQVELDVVPGPGSAELIVESNDPEGPQSVLLAWHGTAIPHLVPARIVASSAPADRPYERTIRLIYPGGRSALTPELDRLECPLPGVEVHPGKNSPMATQLAISGQLVSVLGELELHLKVRAPEQPRLVETIATVIIRYGKSVIPVDLPISISFVGAELTPDSDAVVFSAGGLGDLAGQERLVTLKDHYPERGSVVVYRAPSWLDCQVEPGKEGNVVLRLKLAKQPPEPFLQHTLLIGRQRGADSGTPLRVRVYAPQ